MAACKRQRCDTELRLGGGGGGSADEASPPRARECKKAATSAASYDGGGGGRSLQQFAVSGSGRGDATDAAEVQAGAINSMGRRAAAAGGEERARWRRLLAVILTDSARNKLSQ
jgi:hypothetical protein